jgi:hypothetical protein
MIGSFVARALIACLAILAMTSSAFAYLDPGAGSMLLQGILATIAGVSAIVGVSRDKLRNHWRRLRQRFQHRSSRRDEDI